MIANAEANCRTISMIAQIKAYDVKQRGVHQWVMMFDAGSVSLPWQRSVDDKINTAEYDGLCVMVHPLGMDGAYRWVIKDSSSTSPFTDDCWLVGRCDTLQEAVAGAEKAMGVLVNEAQQ